MASQFHIAHSRIVVGAGIVAGGPYACAEDAFLRAPLLGKVRRGDPGCMLNSLWMLGVPNIAALEGRISYSGVSAASIPSPSFPGPRLSL